MNTNTPSNQTLKIVVIGGTGLIGKKVVANLHATGHDVTSASPSSGVDTLTGKGLKEAFAGAQVVVDLSNSPNFDDEVSMTFFTTAGRNIAAAEKAAGVKHHVALSVVGTERLQAMGYFRAKLAQENLIKTSGIPYTIVRATQFFEFVGSIAQASTSGQTVRVSTAMMQPILSDDIADAVARIAVAAPLNGMVELAGPDPIRMSDLVRQWLAAHDDSREVVADAGMGYFGIQVDDRSLTPGPNPILGTTHFADWLRESLAHS